MKMKKVLALLLCAVLLVAGSVMATLAYLQDSDSVRNTFTVGKVGISLDELDVDNSSEGENDRDQANAYHLMPGKTYVKDPVVHVDADSENCFLFVKLQNGLKDIIDETTIENQMVSNGWTLLIGSADTYYYKEIVGKGMDIPTFTQFKVKGDISNDTLADYTTEKDAEGNVTGDDVITVTAYAVQAEGFGSAKAAWDASFGAPTTP